jgi:hypothetical protein
MDVMPGEFDTQEHLVPTHGKPSRAVLAADGL